MAEAEYNSMAMKLTRRLDAGAVAAVGYTLSKTEDNGSGIRVLNGDALFPQNSNCFECEWGLSIFDVRHRFVTSLLYELPFGPGKPLLKDGVGGAILGGWQISAIVNKSSGFPRDPAAGTDMPNTGCADLPAEPRVGAGSRTTARRRSQQWFNTAAFARPGGVHLRERRAQHRHRPRHLHHRRVADPQLLLWRDQVAAVPARSVQPVQQPDLGRPADVDGEPALRQINTTRTPMRELQLGVKFAF